MTLKYESEILFDLMKRDGDDTPSDVLPYESELKEKYLKQVVGAYPKLQDYRPEWLNYNLNEYLPADFPLETLSNVTSATVDNVVPYAYKSAILKGNSGVVVGKNKCNMEEIELGWIDGESGAVVSDEGVFIPVKASGTITISNYIHRNARYVYEYDTNGNYLGRTKVETNIVTLVLNQNTTLIKIGFFRATLSTVKSLELQVEQGEIATEYEPYNQTLVSVKMPVLTTTGKNLLDSNNFVGNEFITLNQDQSFTVNSNITTQWSVLYKNLPDFNNVYIYIDIDGATSFGGSIGLFYKGNKISEFSSNKRNGLLIEKLFDEIRVFNAQGTDIKVRLMLSYNAETSYEPYKSNILTVNEDVELRGIGGIKDELNCLTGEVTERIGEIVLDGSENWMKSGFTHDILNEFLLYKNLSKHKEFLMSNQLPVYGSDNERVAKLDNTIYIRVLKNKANTVEEFKTWLASNNIIVLSKLATESIKTVDLTVTDQDGKTTSIIRPIEGTMHIHSDGTPLKPTITMEIPVEAITQNLASFIKEE